ncbi:MAG: hypothetical protein ACREYC_26250 [Gammaproteobacteria bacterium]
MYGHLAFLNHTARKVLARDIPLVDAPELIQEVELLPETVKELHDSRP